MDWFMIIKAFVIGGLLCVIGQILIDKTKLTPARILVAYVTTGTILGGLGIYKYLIDFAGCGATVPLTGFGSLLAKGVIEEVKSNRNTWSIYWRNKKCSRWNRSCNILWIYSFSYFKA